MLGRIDKIAFVTLECDVNDAIFNSFKMGELDKAFDLMLTVSRQFEKFHARRATDKT